MREWLERLLASRAERWIWRRFYPKYTLEQAARIAGPRLLGIIKPLAGRNRILEDLRHED